MAGSYRRGPQLSGDFRSNKAPRLDSLDLNLDAGCSPRAFVGANDQYALRCMLSKPIIVAFGIALVLALVSVQFG